MDPENGAIMRLANRSDKIGAIGREGNVALDVDRPVLPKLGFSKLKNLLLQPSESNLKPMIKFLDVK